MRTTTLYLLAGPKTFRRASKTLFREKNKKNTGWGGNLQNWEKSLRSICIPDGYKPELKAKCALYLKTGDTSLFTQEELDTLRVFVQVDQSGAEALIVAYESTAGDYRQLFIHGIKPHVYVALKLFTEIWKTKLRGLTLDSNDIDILNCTSISYLKSNPKWRELDTLIKQSDNWSLTERYYYLAKQTCHSANYGISWGRFILNILEKSGGKIVLDKGEGKRFLEVYRGLFPEIPERNNRIREQVDKFKILYNLFGHPYQITNENISENTYKEYFAWTAQSTVAEITRTAACDYSEYIWSEHKKWDLLGDCHDSLLTQCPITEAIECSNKIQEFMNIGLTSPIDGTRFNMKSEAQIGFNWGPYDELNPEKNPLGLRTIRWN